MSGVIVKHESTTGIVTDPQEHDTYAIELNAETIGWAVYLTGRWHAVPRSTTGYASDEDGVLDADQAHDSCKTFSSAAPTDTFNDVVSGLRTHWDHLDLSEEEGEPWEDTDLRAFAADVVTRYGIHFADIEDTNSDMRALASERWAEHTEITDAQLDRARRYMRKAVIIIDAVPYGEEI